tara:strand:+ start:108 stop:506 length:399 start_codon:yes stop_codon:yes gene_type:complete
MEKIFFIQILLSGLVAGLIIFQSTLAAPIVFLFLEKKQARIFIRKVFPKLFKLLLSIGLIMLCLNLFFGVNKQVQYLVSIITFIFSTVCLFMVNPANHATDTNNQKRFKLLHKSSVILTMIVLILNLVWPFF